MSGRHLPLAALVGFALLHGPAQGQPVVSFNHTAIYDPVQQRMIVFGGNDLSPFSNATWQLTLGQSPQWNLLSPLGTPPSARFGHAAIYDPTRHRMIVIGGFDGVRKADVWELLLTDPPEWREIVPQGVPLLDTLERRYHTAIYDPVRDRVVIHGGEKPTSVPVSDTWSLWLSPVVRWEQMFPTGDPPVSRYSHSAIYDPVRDCMVVYGGLPGLNLSDLAELSLADDTWRLLPKPPEPRIQGHSAIYDPTRGRMVLFGGGELNQHFNDVWTMTPGSPPTWTELFPTGAPSPRSGHSAILDSVHQRMIVFGGFPNVTESTWGLSLESPSHWSPLRPLFSAGTPTLQLPTVTVGDTASVPMTLSNHGMSPLTVSALQRPLGVTFGIQAPFQIDWNQSRTGTVTLVATTPGVASDSVVVESNDPVTPRAVIPLGIGVLGLDFRARVLAEPDSVPLGASFIVIASPEPGVHVERATLFYSIAEASSFDSLALTPLGTDFVGSVPATAVTERGVDYYVRVDNSGFSSWQPAQAPDSVFTQRVARSDSIRGVPQPEFLSGRSIEVEVELPLGSIFESGTIHYRRGGEPNYATDPLARDVLGRPVATIPDTIVGPRGVEYWIEATTLGGPLQFASAQSPATIRVTVPSLQEPVAHPGMRYRLLSVPLEFVESSTSTLADLLTDQLGTYDPVRWRAYRYDPVLPGNVELSPSTLGAFEPVPGRAFWLISRDGHQVNTGPVQGFSTPTNREYPVPLAAGWNAIGNPFAFPVAWGDVRRDSNAVGDPFAFDPRGGSIGDYSLDSPTVLDPFEGYFVHSSEVETLWVLPRAAAPVSSPAATRLEASSDGSWRFRLRARTQSAEDGSNDFGVAGTSTFDFRKWSKPPRPPGPWVRIGFIRPESGSSETYRRDLRPVGARGETWEIEVRSGSAGEVVTVEGAPIVSLAHALTMRLIDRETGEIISATNAEVAFAYRIVSRGAAPYRLAIVAGSEEYVAEAVQKSLSVPAQVTLDPNAPNPFREATRIRFGMPRADEVTLEVFSVLGQRIAVPVDRSRLAPGHHSVVWDGATAGGEQAPAGVYLLRLKVGNESVVRRAVRLP